MIDDPREQVWLLGGGLYSPQVCMDHLATEMLLAVGTFNIDLFACVMSLLWACVAVLVFAVQHSLIAYECPPLQCQSDCQDLEFMKTSSQWVLTSLHTWTSPMMTNMSCHLGVQLKKCRERWWMAAPSGNDNNEERYVAVDGIMGKGGIFVFL